METFRLCSGLFILDGIKRDQLDLVRRRVPRAFLSAGICSGDEELVQRTLLALRGKDPVRQHMNTIVDYSMLWIASVKNSYEMSGNREFLDFIYPKVISLLEYCLRQTNESGFLYGREDDWIFVDWADLDKEGAACARSRCFSRTVSSALWNAPLFWEKRHADTKNACVSFAGILRNISGMRKKAAL